MLEIQDSHVCVDVETNSYFLLSLKKNENSQLAYNISTIMWESSEI